MVGNCTKLEADRIMTNRWLALLLGLCLLLAAGCACLAADFSADVYAGPKALQKQGKIYTSGKMIRVETTMGGSQITIMRPDKKMAWLISPATKQYVEAPMTRPEMMDPRSDKMFTQNATKKNLGKETVSGFSCEKTVYTFKGMPGNSKSGAGQQAIRCYSSKLDWPIRTQMIAPGRTFVQELRNIKLGKQPATLFVVPKGYKKMAMPTPSGTPGGKMPAPRGK
jgi:hypothetical protein